MLAIFMAAIAVLVVIDRFSKNWVLENLSSGETRRFFRIGDTEIVNLTFYENDGAVFGSFGGQRALLLVIPILALVACFYLLIKNVKTQSRWISAGLALVISGGIGNLIDRIFRGGLVVDYFEVALFRFAIFNFADCCVTVGATILIISILHEMYIQKKHGDSENSDSTP